MKELIDIQTELKAPKNQRNLFGKYNYRSCEDILEAVKPLLKKHECTLFITDCMELVGERYYIKATVSITNKEGIGIETQAYAREEETKKGMDASQITGSASSYARKYALNGLFCIDDTKDADATNTHDKKTTPAPPQAPDIDQGDLDIAIQELKEAKTREELAQAWKRWKGYHGIESFKHLCAELGKQFN